MEKIDYKTPMDFEATVYTVDYENNFNIQERSLLELCEEYCEKTTSPMGISPVIFSQDNKLCYWQKNGHPKVIEEFETNEEALHASRLSWLYDVDNFYADAPVYFFNKDEAQKHAEEVRAEEEEIYR